MSRRVEKAIETKVEKARMEKTKGRRKESRRKREARRKGKSKGEQKKEEKIKKGKDNESKESIERMRGLEWGGKNSKVEGRSQEISISKVLQIDSCLWEKSE